MMVVSAKRIYPNKAASHLSFKFHTGQRPLTYASLYIYRGACPVHTLNFTYEHGRSTYIFKVSHDDNNNKKKKSGVAVVIFVALDTFGTEGKEEKKIRSHCYIRSL